MNRKSKQAIELLVYKVKNEGLKGMYQCDNQQQLKGVIDLVQRTLAKCNVNYTHPLASDWGIHHPSGRDAIIHSYFDLENGGGIFLCDITQKDEVFEWVNRN